MTKKLNYTVDDTFEHGGVTYKAGDTFKIPDGWQLDDEYTKLKKRANPKKVFTTFAYEVQIGEDESFEGSRIVRTPVMDSRRVLLPVA